MSFIIKQTQEENIENDIKFFNYFRSIVEKLLDEDYYIPSIKLRSYSMTNVRLVYKLIKNRDDIEEYTISLPESLFFPNRVEIKKLEEKLNIHVINNKNYRLMEEEDNKLNHISLRIV